jgi:hypothetical protein
VAWLRRTTAAHTLRNTNPQQRNSLKEAFSFPHFLPTHPSLCPRPCPRPLHPGSLDAKHAPLFLSRLRPCPCPCPCPCSRPSAPVTAPVVGRAVAIVVKESIQISLDGGQGRFPGLSLLGDHYRGKSA